MKIAVPKEVAPGERRVALVPHTAARLVDSGMSVLVESGAGEGALHSDREYEEAGATIVSDAVSLYESANVVLKVQKPTVNETLGAHEVEVMRESTTLIAFLQPLNNVGLVERLAEKRVTAFSMDAIPRIARAQSMDALTSMASIVGYKAALLAANLLGRFFPMMVTAAGTLPPARGLVLGAGVAGLQAIATARRLGAVMYGYDVRPATKEQVLSLGATFIEAQVTASEAEGAGGYARELAQEAQQRERQLIHQHIKTVDFVITTAAVPGRRAPVLVTGEMVRDMRPGSVIVDIAAETGGNCELTRPGETVVEHGVIIHGPLELPSSMATHASQMYSRNISSLLRHLVRDGELRLDFQDEITRSCCITHNGRILHEPTLAAIQGARQMAGTLSGGETP
jgi:NAD(P) transhydrogenase subunit alpha